MKLFLVCSLLVSISVAVATETSCNCGWTNSGRIVGGKETLQNQYPWMVTLNHGNCGGSIISPWHVLTAAHCTYRRSPSSIYFTVGVHDIRGSDFFKKQPSKVVRKIEHPAYDNDKTINDLSILVAAQEIAFSKIVGPVCLPNKKLSLVDQYIKIMGWGSTMGTSTSSKLLEVDVKVISVESCRKTWEEVQLSGTQLCTFGGLKKDSCRGDSGGPLVWLDPETNKYTQVALVSYGDLKCGSYKPSVNTDVSAYVDWINRMVSSSKPGAKTCRKI